MESRAILATMYPCLPAHLGVKVGLHTLRLPGFQRRTIGTRLEATGAFGRGSATVEIKLSWKLGEGGFGAVAYDEQRRNRRDVTTSIIPPFGEEVTSSIKSFLGEDHQDGDDEEEEGGGNDREGRGNEYDDEEDSTDDEEDSSDEEDTSEDEDEDEGDQEDEGECD